VAFKQLASTFRAVKRYREFIKFIVAFLIYNDGIIMVLEFAAIIGAVLFGMTQESLIFFIILVQITNVLGSYVFGVMADRGGSKLSLMISFALMIGAILWLYFAQSITVYFVIGAIGGLAMAGLQSVSRAMAGQFAPPGQSAEFFGFFAVAGRSSSFVGPTVFGLLVVWATNRFEAAGMSVLAAEQMGHRVSLFSIVAFLVVGMIILLFVNEQKGREVGRTKIGAPEAEPVTK
jgi:UMF1 family MFS transporter